MKKYIAFLMVFYFLSSCGGMYMDDEPSGGPRGGPRGDVEEIELPDHLAEESYLLKCDPEEVRSVSAMNVSDVLFGYIIPVNNPLKKTRSCVYLKLAKAGDEICDIRHKLEAQKEKARSSTERANINLSIDQLNRIQNRLSTNFDKVNRRIYKLANKYDNKRSSNTGKQFLYGIFRDELEGWSYVTDTGYELSCDEDSDDEEDDSYSNRRRGNYGDRRSSNLRTRNREERRARNRSN